ncbi:MarR family winged helix-turn-helix transcriptional regulator [Agrobacterium tumefaciens]|uniref:MarR family winged helix-turn-helix transcriptional regulator n=1 Tax=Agrobacterium tumefaciens TaxID=358 RepID=UPI000EF1EFDD|nr:MarR family transcriptional regulator [Agrobacterium tumefaciens]NSZ35999.1 MarR family transcriptional regulator [Agrobacterium tumefaciens]QLG25714.1 MarR family transcriptional regulator [Agrobacterium tumefaciens]UXS89584.1 MarR family transcriptional regulator [Agrobacterium tumefaciens]
MQLSFALYGAMGRIVRLHKPFLDPLGLTFPQYLVMLELFSRAPQSVGELGNALSMDTGTITPLLKRLEASGMVTRRRDAADERRVLVDLTPEGASRRDDIWSVTEKIKAACQLDEQGIIALRDTLQNLGHPQQD